MDNGKLSACFAATAAAMFVYAVIPEEQEHKREPLTNADRAEINETVDILSSMVTQEDMRKAMGISKDTTADQCIESQVNKHRQLELEKSKESGLTTEKTTIQFSRSADQMYFHLQLCTRATGTTAQGQWDDKMDGFTEILTLD